MFSRSDRDIFSYVMAEIVVWRILCRQFLHYKNPPDLKPVVLLPSPACFLCRCLLDKQTGRSGWKWGKVGRPWPLHSPYLCCFDWPQQVDSLQSFLVKSMWTIWMKCSAPQECPVVQTSVGIKQSKCHIINQTSCSGLSDTLRWPLLY